MKRLCMILLLIMALGFSGPALGAEKPAEKATQETPAPTQAQLLAAQQATLQERLQRLEAQYLLTQQQLSAVLSQRKALADEEAQQKQAKGEKGK